MLDHTDLVGELLRFGRGQTFPVADGAAGGDRAHFERGGLIVEVTEIDALHISLSVLRAYDCSRGASIAVIAEDFEDVAQWDLNG